MYNKSADFYVTRKKQLVFSAASKMYRFTPRACLSRCEKIESKVLRHERA